MKKSILILSAIAGIVYLSSCGGNEQPVDTTQISQAQLDSIKKATEDSITAAQALAKDSLLNKIAEDSIAAANAAAAAAANNSGSKKPISGKPATKPGTTKPTTPTKPVEPAKPAPRTPQQIEDDKKAAKFGDKAAKDRLSQDSDNKKAAKFGDKSAKEKEQQTSDEKKASKFNR